MLTPAPARSVALRCTRSARSAGCSKPPHSLRSLAPPTRLASPRLASPRIASSRIASHRPGKVPDARLTRLAELYDCQRVVPHALEFVDIAGLVVGASEGAGLGNKFLSNIRGVNALLHVLRCYAPNRDDLIHVEGRVDPVADAHLINTELALSDLGQVEKRMQRIKSGKPLKSKLASVDPAAAKVAAAAEMAVLGKLAGLLEEGIGVRNAGLSEDELETLWEVREDEPERAGN